VNASSVVVVRCPGQGSFGSKSGHTHFCLLSFIALHRSVVQRESFATRSYLFRSGDGLDKRIAVEGIDLIERDDEDKRYGMRIELSDRVWLLKSSAANSSMFISLSLTRAETLNCTNLRSRFG
jgi:hypothetical protein